MRDHHVWRWALGLIYIVLVAIIWIAASFVVQSVVDAGVSPFLVTYICNSLFIVYIPVAEIGRFVEDSYGGLWFWRSKEGGGHLSESRDSEEAVLLGEETVHNPGSDSADLYVSRGKKMSEVETGASGDTEVKSYELEKLTDDQTGATKLASKQLDAKGRWTRPRVAWVSLLICPFWFLAQLSFNLSLKYTTVTSNTILSSASSLFTFLVSLAFLGERFSWVKLISVLLCMGGTIIVSLGDSKTGVSVVAGNPVLGDVLALVSAGLYAVYITLIRKKLPSDDGKNGHASMAQFLGYLGLFNFLIFLPVGLLVNFTKLEPFYALTWKQFGLIVGKGLLDNVLSDYLWAKAVLLTSTTVATASLTIQVPLAAIVDSFAGNAPHAMDYIGAAAVMAGFTGINIPSDDFCMTKDTSVEMEDPNFSSNDRDNVLLSMSNNATTSS